MNPSLLLHWHYLMFLVPFSIAALLLLLSSLRLGHHHGGHAGHGHVVSHAAPVHAGGHGPVHTVSHHGGHHGAASARHHGSNARANGKAQAPQHNMLLALFGVGRAPLPMVIEAFFLIWGLSGCIAVQQMLRGIPAPTLAQALPVMAIAAGCGLVGARVASELIGRLMPEEETSIVSRNGLFGLKGSVAFPVSETGGRIMVYDDYGSLHDESCRVAPGHPPIERGRKAMVVDCDARGCLLVEEVVE